MQKVLTLRTAASGWIRNRHFYNGLEQGHLINGFFVKWYVTVQHFKPAQSQQQGKSSKRTLRCYHLPVLTWAASLWCRYLNFYLHEDTIAPVIGSPIVTLVENDFRSKVQGRTTECIRLTLNVLNKPIIHNHGISALKSQKTRGQVSEKDSLVLSMSD